MIGRAVRLCVVLVASLLAALVPLAGGRCGVRVWGYAFDPGAATWVVRAR